MALVGMSYHWGVRLLGFKFCKIIFPSEQQAECVGFFLSDHITFINYLGSMLSYNMDSQGTQAWSKNKAYACQPSWNVFEEKQVLF